MRAIDLFCGCGGMSAGIRALGIEVVAGVDVAPDYISTFRHNFSGAAAIKADLSELSPADLMERAGIRPGDLDLLVGGPPCQGFSKNVPRRHRYLEDERNRLVLAFLHHAKTLMPRHIVMENVAEMKNGFESSYTDEIVDQLSSIGYAVNYGVLNAADFGVPQRRRRAFFVASRDVTRAPSMARATHFPDSSLSLFSRAQHVTIEQAISDLPRLRHGEGIELTPYATGPRGKYQAQMRSSSGFVANHIARKLQPLQFERLSALLPGQGLKDLPEHLKTKGGYSGAYGRLTWDMISPTITRWVFHPGSGRWGHPEDFRLLTMREVARVQSFHDDFRFVGSYNQQAGQLGNAVPPLLMQRVVEEVLSCDYSGVRSSIAMNDSNEIRSSSAKTNVVF